MVFSGTTLQITPAAGLVTSGVQYTVLIPNDAIRNAGGVAYGGLSADQYVFNVKDSDAPYVTDFIPLNGETNFGSANDLVVTFNELIQRGSGNIVLTPSSGASLTQATQVTFSATSNELTYNGTKLQINPSNVNRPIPALSTSPIHNLDLITKFQ